MAGGLLTRGILGLPWFLPSLGTIGTVPEPFLGPVFLHPSNFKMDGLHAG